MILIENKSIIAITPGDPAGIGPDIAIDAAIEVRNFPVVHYCDPQVITDRARALGIPLRVFVLDSIFDAKHTPCGIMQILPIELNVPVVPGVIDPANSSYVLKCLNAAIADCSKGTISAIVTGPVSKACMNDAGIVFKGHTEYIAKKLRIREPVMVLDADGFRVALATTHLPLARVPREITRDRIIRILKILYEDLQNKYGIQDPKIGLCGLNPHAGEAGHMGREEIDIISPAADQVRMMGIKVTGPLSADTIFSPEIRKDFDVILSMYHDQGLTALKAVGFGNAVNVTLGLPIIRTSVDHGTASTLTGTGQANSSSLKAAVALANQLSTNSCQ